MFDLEQMINGVCVDFINIHDGGNIGAATLNPSPLCDDLPNLPNRTYLSTGNEITIYFSADDSGEGKGFEFIMTPVSSGKFHWFFLQVDIILYFFPEPFSLIMFGAVSETRLSFVDCID